MMRLVVWITAAVLVALASTTASAEFSVQIGAFRTVGSGFEDDARAFGSVYTDVTAAGVTRVRVGPFSSRAEADAAVRDIRAAGYNDAFVLRTGMDASSSLPSVAAAPPVSVSHTSDFDRLPADVRANAVYLDGALHVKEGDRFIPLREYNRYR